MMHLYSHSKIVLAAVLLFSHSLSCSKLDVEPAHNQAPTFLTSSPERGRAQAKISQETGRAIEFVVKPGEKLTFAFLGQFKNVEIESTQEVKFFGSPTMLSTDGFMRIKASGQATRPNQMDHLRLDQVDTFEFTLQPGESIPNFQVQAFKHFEVQSTGRVTCSSGGTLSSEGFAKIKVIRQDLEKKKSEKDLMLSGVLKIETQDSIRG